MDPLMLTIVGWIIAGGIALWQNRRAVRAETELRRVLESLPQQVGAEVQKVLTFGGLRHLVSFKDIDGDGSQELLLQGPEGAHGEKLKILKWDFEGMDFYEMAELSTETGGFDIRDLDGDGTLEIATYELDYDARPDLSYVELPRIEVVHKWDGQQFKEFSRRRIE